MGANLLKVAKYLQDKYLAKFAQENYPKIKTFADILAAPYPRDDLRSGLIATLDQKVQAFAENPQYPISTQPSKTALRTLYNGIKLFYTNFQSQKDIDTLITSFQPVISQWGNYKSQFLTDAFINSFSGNSTLYTFWKKLKQRIDDSIGSIDSLLKKTKAGETAQEVQTIS